MRNPFKILPHNGTGWFHAQYHTAGGVILPPGAAFYIRRKPRAGVDAVDDGFIWTIPSVDYRK